MHSPRFLPLLAFALVASAAGPTPSEAQHKGKLQHDMQRLHANVLGMVDAMPEAGLRSAPTEGVRDFAQQIEHVSVGALNIIASGFDQNAIPVGDPEVYLNSKAELKAMVDRAFTSVHQMLADMTESDLAREARLFGRVDAPRWMHVQVAHEHGVWTLGATVPYVRLQGGTPGGFDLIPQIH